VSISFLHDPARSATLYTWVMSPFAMKVHCFLLYKQVNFRCYYVNPLRISSQVPLGRQLPVVRIGEEYRADSTPIGVWLDEVFPEQPRLLPDDPADRDRVLAMDRWVTDRLIPITFRIPQEPGFNLDRISSGWRLSRVMSLTCAGGLPRSVRVLWPLILSLQPFLKQELAKADPHLPLDVVVQHMYDEFRELLAGGPFFGGRDTPSMADLAAFPQFLLPYLTGMPGSGYFLELVEVVEWLQRVNGHVLGSPSVLPEVARVRELDWLQL